MCSIILVQLHGIGQSRSQKITYAVIYLSYTSIRIIIYTRPLVTVGNINYGRMYLKLSVFIMCESTLDVTARVTSLLWGTPSGRLSTTGRYVSLRKALFIGNDFASSTTARTLDGEKALGIIRIDWRRKTISLSVTGSGFDRIDDRTVPSGSPA